MVFLALVIFCTIEPLDQHNILSPKIKFYLLLNQSDIYLFLVKLKIYGEMTIF